MTEQKRLQKEQQIAQAKYKEEPILQKTRQAFEMKE